MSASELRAYNSYRLDASHRPSRKLGRQQEGLFKIIEKVGYSFKLRLLDYIKVHLVFSPNKLRLATEDLLLRQINIEAEPILVNRENK